MGWSLIGPFWDSTWVCVRRILGCSFLKVWGDVIAWDLFEMHWDSSVNLIPYVEESSRVCFCGVNRVSLQSCERFISVWSVGIDDVNLGGLSSCGMRWFRIPKFERNFIPKKEFEKGCFLEYWNVFLILVWAMCLWRMSFASWVWHVFGLCDSYRFRKIKGNSWFGYSSDFSFGFSDVFRKLPLGRWKGFSWWNSDFWVWFFSIELVTLSCDVNLSFSVGFCR